MISAKSAIPAAWSGGSAAPGRRQSTRWGSCLVPLELHLGPLDLLAQVVQAGAVQHQEERFEVLVALFDSDRDIRLRPHDVHRVVSHDRYPTTTTRKAPSSETEIMDASSAFRSSHSVTS